MKITNQFLQNINSKMKSQCSPNAPLSFIHVVLKSQIKEEIASDTFLRWASEMETLQILVSIESLVQKEIRLILKCCM